MKESRTNQYAQDSSTFPRSEIKSPNDNSPSLEKVVRNKDDQIPTQLLTAWCDNKRRRGGVLHNNKKNLAKNIRLIIPGAAKDGLLTTWVYFALDEAYWKYLISQLGSKKTESTGTEPNPRSTPPPVRHDDGLTLHLRAPRLEIDLRPPPPLLVTTTGLRRLRRPHRAARILHTLLEMKTKMMEIMIL